MKECGSCKQTKPTSDFYGRGDKKGYGIQAHCKVCVRAKRKEYVMNNRPKIKNLELKRSFGIGLDEYNKMFLSQNGCCAICNRHQIDFSKKLAVDHDHNSKKIRALLCEHCNHGLGKFQDSVLILEKALNYLKKHSLGSEGYNIGLGEQPKKDGYFYS